MLRFIDASDRARVVLHGKDARPFLHRMSTQHITEMKPGESRRDVLTTDKGRIVDLVHVVDLRTSESGPEGLLLVGSPGRGEIIRAWLDRYLFTEDVQLEEVSGQGGVVEVTGPEAPVVEGALMVPTVARASPTWLGVAMTGARPSLTGAQSATADEWDSDRVAHVVVGPAELSEKWNPLDLGLADAIHWNKGCYIGQEVIARLDTYQKQTRRLVGLVIADAHATIAAGAQVLVEGAPVGEVTSVSPRHNGALPSALAVLKGVADGARVTVKTASGEHAATVAARSPDASAPGP